MPRVLKDPLVHFLALGVLLFVVSGFVGGEAEDDSTRIVVSAAEIERLTGAVSMLQQRTPTRDDLMPLIEPLIRDEVMYREALALGLDQNDDEVRRRLIEKMVYLTLDRADPQPPSEEALRAFYDADPGAFALPSSITFEQVFFSPRQRGDSLHADIEAAREALEEGADPFEVGDPTPLELRYERASRERVEVLFGAQIARTLFGDHVGAGGGAASGAAADAASGVAADAASGTEHHAEPGPAAGEWQGPFTSDFGEHLLRLVEHRPARQPSFEEARERVAQAYADEQRAARNEREIARMRARYDVIIEWPESVAGAGQ